MQKDLRFAFAVSAAIVREGGETYCRNEQVELEAFNQSVSNLVRLTRRIGKGRHKRDITPTLSEYLDAKHAEPAG